MAYRTLIHGGKSTIGWKGFYSFANVSQVLLDQRSVSNMRVPGQLLPPAQLHPANSIHHRPSCYYHLLVSLFWRLDSNYGMHEHL